MNSLPVNLVVEDLTVRYPHASAPALVKVSADFQPGGLNVLLGPNGSGKSTLLGTIARLLAPASGHVLLDGRDIHALAPRAFAREVGILFQEARAPHDLLVRDLVLEGRYPYLGLLAMPSAEDRAIADRALARCGISSFATRPMGELSSGQRRMAWVAMLLAQMPRCLLLDEPTTYLDLARQVEVLDLVRRLVRDLGLTVVMSIHDLNLAAAYADRVFLLQDGHLVGHGPVRAVLSASVVRQVFGVDVSLVTDPETGALACLPIPGRT